MKTTIKEITPQWAKQILETRNPHNRRVSERFVDKLARDISNGAFVTTHQGIAFNENGDLLDGQHRLAAVVMANKSITLPVTTGIPAAFKLNGSSINTFELIDGGRSRGTGAMLQMAGYTNGNKVAASVKIAICASLGENAETVSISTAQAHKALMYIGKSVVECVQISSSAKIVRAPAPVVGVFALYHNSFPEKANNLLRDVCDVTGEHGALSRNLSSQISKGGLSCSARVTRLMRVSAAAIFHSHNGSKASRLCGSESALDWIANLDKGLLQKLNNIATL
jgi:hypothetical protein